MLWLVLLLLAAAGGAWWWYQQRQAGDAAGAAGPAGAASAPGTGAPGGGGGRRFSAVNRVQPVSVTAVRRQDMRVLLPAIGSIAALNTATVRAKVDGELKAIRFKEGQQVRAGQLLAEIDPSTYQIALAQAQGQLSRDQAQLRNAQIDLERYRDLLSKDSIARQQVDTQDALVRQLQGTVQTDQAQVDNAKLLLSYTRVTAPISGRVGLKQVDLGNVVHASDTAGIITITQTQPISVVFAVPEANLPQINRKLKAAEAMAVEAWDRDQKTRLAQGRVSTTDNAIDPVTGTIKLKAEFPNADGMLFPNQFVNVRMQVDLLRDVLAIPSNSVQRGAQGTFVYVVKEDGTVTMRRVRLGATEGEWVSVEGELAAGERVVTDGADRLREGAKVEVIAPAARAAADAASASGRGRRHAGGDPAAAASAPAGGASSPSNSTRAEPSAASPAAGASRARAAGDPTTPRPAGDGATAAGGEVPPWLDRLPPDVRERYLKMNPEERKAFVERMRERRRQQQNDGG